MKKFLNHVKLVLDNNTLKPKRSTSDSAGHDIFSNQNIVLESKKSAEIKLPFHFETTNETKEFNVDLFVRSSFGINKKIRLVKDGEIVESIALNPLLKGQVITLFNDSEEDITIKQGEHFSQFILSDKEINSNVPFAIESVIKEELDKHLHIIQSKVVFNEDLSADYIIEEDIELKPNEQMKLTTGLKSKIETGTWMGVYIRDEFKDKILLANGVGVIDADYYNNPNNDGHLFFAIVNKSDKPLVLPKGSSIIQLKAQEYLVLEDEKDNPVLKNRDGGIGSTN